MTASSDVDDDGLDPPTPGQVVLLGVVSALAGLVIGIFLASTPAQEVGVVAGGVLGPVVGGAHAWRSGTTLPGLAVFSAVALGTYALVYATLISPTL